MDEFGNRLSDKQIKDLFRDKPPYLDDDLCNLFKIKMSIFQDSSSDEEETTKVEDISSEILADIESKFHEKFGGVEEEVDLTARFMGEFKKKIPPEVLKKIDESFLEIPEKRKVLDSYKSNTDDEEYLATLAKNFQRQFRYIYPRGPRHFLLLPNEHGTMKIVCTTLSPYLCTQHELRWLDTCARFIADYLDYVHLESPRLAPQSLASPGYILEQRKGNSLDFSSVLCSFLISAGYDAYVIHGYATKEVCTMDVSKEKCPEFQIRTIATMCAEYLVSDEVEAKPLNKYQKLELNKDVSLKLNKFDAMIKEKNIEETKRIEKETTAEERLKWIQQSEAEDPFFGQRVHFWILVKSGRREISETFFIESTTGERIPTDCPNYLSIEFAWNNRNFWVNKQRELHGCTAICFDFDDTIKWDYFLPETNEFPMVQTWTETFEIKHEHMQEPLPHGTKEMCYRRCRVEKFNPFILPDGCVVKVWGYEDEHYTVLINLKEIFKNRNDNLLWRYTNSETNYITEFFEEGRDDGLKQYSYCTGDENAKRHIYYYNKIRPDGLIERITTKSCVIDTYNERRDFLHSRKIIYFVKDENSLESHKTEESDSESDFSVDPEKAKAVEKLEVEEPLEGKYITPEDFETFEPLFQDVDFDTWKLEDFVSHIDPAYRVLPESESDEEVAYSTIDEINELPLDDLLEMEFENDYMLFLSMHRSKIQELGNKNLESIYEELTEDAQTLKTKKKRLKRLIAEKSAHSTTGGELRTVKKKVKKPEFKDPNVEIVESLKAHCESSVSDEEYHHVQRRFKKMLRRKKKYRKREVEPGERLILDIAETHDRNPSIPADKNIFKIRYLLDEGRYSILFHPSEAHITLRGVRFTKPTVKSLYHTEVFEFTDDLSEEVHPGYHTEPFLRLFLYKELLKLMRGEKKVVREASTIETSVSRFLKQRARENEKLKLIPSITDTNRRDEAKQRKRDIYFDALLTAYKDVVKSDYLTPAFGLIGFQQPLNEKRAELAFRYMINSFVKQILASANFIAEKLAKEMEEYRQKKEQAVCLYYKKNASKDLTELLNYFRKVDLMTRGMVKRVEWLQKFIFRDFWLLRTNLINDPRLAPFVKGNGRNFR